MERQLRFGVAATVADDVEGFGRAAEALGVDLITVPEGATEFRDPFVTLARFARSTERATLTTGVTAPRLRHPAVLAGAFATLHELSGGRAVIGLGSGDLGLVRLGEAPARLAELEQYAFSVRALCRGEQVDIGARPVRLRWARHDVPLWLAADGPRMLQLAGRVADGVIVGQAGHPDIVQAVESRIADAARSAGRSSDDVQVWYMLRAHVTEHEHGAIDQDGLDEYGARQAYFLWRVSGCPDAGSMVTTIRERKGLMLDADVAARLHAYCSEYSEQHAFGTKHNVELLDRHDLTQWAGRLFYVSGRPEHVEQQVRALMAVGARNFLIPPELSADVDTALTGTARVAEVLNTIRRGHGSTGISQPTV